MKTCTKCLVEKDVSEFCIRRPPFRAKDGRNYQCKTCCKTASRNWHKNNPDYRAPTSLNKEYIRQAAHIPKTRFLRAARHARKTRGLEFELTYEQWAKLVIGKDCHYCDGPLNPTGVGLDRIDNTKGYSFENCVPCCRRCNTAKMNTSFIDFIQLCSKVAAKFQNNVSGGNVK